MSVQAMIAALGLVTGSTNEQQEPQPMTPAAQEGSVVDLGEIEVVSERLLREQVQSFTREATAPPPGRPLARWDRSVCVGAFNLDARYAQFMIDRVVTVANDLGLETRPPGCKPNIMIVAAADADELAQGLVTDDEPSFRPSLNAVSLDQDALERFKTTDAPVRWWHVSMPVSVDTGDVAVTTFGEVIVGKNGPEPLAIKVRDASRLRANTRDDLQRATIIIDTSRVGTIGFGALSDYVAMIALAQMAPDADTSAYDTVLNLFREGADRSAGLTQWDRDYLKALYSARRDYARPTQQARAIVSGVVAQREQRPQ